MRFIHKLALVLKCYVCVVQQFNILCKQMWFKNLFLQPLLPVFGGDKGK